MMWLYLTLGVWVFAFYAVCRFGALLSGEDHGGVLFLAALLFLACGYVLIVHD